MTMTYPGKRIYRQRTKRPCHTYQQLGAWIDMIKKEEDFRYVIVLLNTSAYANAAFDLRVTDQVDFVKSTIHLGLFPYHRIPLTSNLQGWLRHWGDERPLNAKPRTVLARLNGLSKRVGERMPMPSITTSAIRHFMTVEMRHVDANLSSNECRMWRGRFDAPDKFVTSPVFRLQAAKRAVDAVLSNLQLHTKRNLFAPSASK